MCTYICIPIHTAASDRYIICASMFVCVRERVYAESIYLRGNLTLSVDDRESMCMCEEKN